MTEQPIDKFNAQVTASESDPAPDPDAYRELKGNITPGRRPPQDAEDAAADAFLNAQRDRDEANAPTELPAGSIGSEHTTTLPVGSIGSGTLDGNPATEDELLDAIQDGDTAAIKKLQYHHRRTVV